MFLKNKGCIHLYHGEGKGKTTCAMGLALRFAHYGKKVLVIQCLKNGNSGEIHQLSRLENVTVKAEMVSNAFTWNMTEQEKVATRVLHDKFMSYARETSWDMLVLDDICAALNQNLVDKNLVEQLLDRKKDKQEIVMTGRNPPEFLLKKADYITKMCLQQHPFAGGLPPREGIEY